VKFLPYILKNVLRHKLRSLFTAISIALSLFLVTLLYGYLAFQRELGDKSAHYNRLIITHRQGLTFLLPVAHVEKVRSLEGVKAASPMSWFGGLYKDDRLPFAQFATDPAAIFSVFDEYRLPPQQLSAWQHNRTACIVGRKIADNRGWKTGDKILLKSPIYDCDLELTVEGIYDGPSTADLEMLWFHYQYLDEVLKAKRVPVAGMVGTIMLKGTSAAVLPDLSRRIEDRFASSDAPARAMTEQAFQQMFLEMLGNVQAFIRNTALAVVFSLVCVAANAMAMSLRERTREVAVLKAIGFGRGLVLALVLGEALSIALAGGAIGAVGGKLLFDSVDFTFLGAIGLSNFYIPWSTTWLGMALAGFVGLASGIVPAWRAAQISVVGGLRKVV